MERLSRAFFHSRSRDSASSLEDKHHPATITVGSVGSASPGNSSHNSSSSDILPPMPLSVSATTPTSTSSNPQPCFLFTSTPLQQRSGPASLRPGRPSPSSSTGFPFVSPGPSSSHFFFAPSSPFSPSEALPAKVACGRSMVSVACETDGDLFAGSQSCDKLANTATGNSSCFVFSMPKTSTTQPSTNSVACQTMFPSPRNAVANTIAFHSSNSRNPHSTHLRSAPPQDQSVHSTISPKVNQGDEATSTSAISSPPPGTNEFSSDRNSSPPNSSSGVASPLANPCIPPATFGNDSGDDDGLICDLNADVDSIPSSSSDEDSGSDEIRGSPPQSNRTLPIMTSPSSITNAASREARIFQHFLQQSEASSEALSAFASGTMEQRWRQLYYLLRSVSANLDTASPQNLPTVMEMLTMIDFMFRQLSHDTDALPSYEALAALPVVSRGVPTDVIEKVTLTGHLAETPTAFPTCPICLDEFVVDDHVRTLHCGHLFHVLCADKWFAIDARCPVCKQDIRTPTDTAFPSCAGALES